MSYLQQGDVLLKSIESFPEGARTEDAQTRAKILAFGEATGHKHAVVGDENAVEAFRILNKIYLNVLSPVALRHEEHREILIPPGKYEIGIVVEADHMAGIVRQVAD